VRIAIISLIVSSLLTVAGIVVSAATSDKGGKEPRKDPTPVGPTEIVQGVSEGKNSGDSPTPTPSPSPTPTPSPSPGSEDITVDPDGLTTAERELRDSLNDDQWQHDSCTRTTVPDAKAALQCTVSVQDTAGFEYAMQVAVTEFPTKDDLRSAFRKYAANLQLGNCDVQQGVQGRWTDGTSSKPIGDMACFVNTTGMYDIIRTFYERPVAIEVVGSDPVWLTNWVNTMDPVFR
jgi:hypothetical protein